MLSGATKTGAAGFALLVAWVMAGGCGSDSSSSKGASSNADDVIGNVLSEVIPDDSAGAPVVIEISQRSLKPTEQVVPGFGDSAYVPQGDYWFALVDYSFSALWGKPVRYAFVDEATGQVTLEDQGWWPQIGDASLPDAGVGLTSIFSPREPEAASPPQPASGGDRAPGHPPTCCSP